MTRTLLILLISTSTIGLSFGQVKISGGVYSDTTVTEPIKNVRVTLKYNDYKKTFKTDKKGQFIIVFENPGTEFTIEIKKKGYSGYSIDFDKSKSEIRFDVILRKNLSMHDNGYEGPSELIWRTKR